MSWRGQGGRRAKGRRGDQDPELDNTAWLAELEREAVQADEDEDDWASTLRGRRSPAPPSPGRAPPAPEPGPAPAADPAPSDHRLLGMEPEGSGPAAWSPDPATRDPAPDPDWAWRPPASDAFGEPQPGREEYGDPRQGTGPEPGWSSSQVDPGGAGWLPAGADTPTGAWSPADPLPSDPVYPAGGDDGYPERQEPGYPGSRDAGYPDARRAEPLNGLEPGYPEAPEPGYPDPPLAGREPNYPTGYPEAREPDYPVGREPDYPALFGELYRRSAGQQDPIWEAPPAAEPLPDPGQPEAVPGTWPFEEATQSWEPSDRSFIWPSDELPSAPAEWEQTSSAPWLDDPDPRPPAQPDPPAPALDQTAAWPAPPPGPDPAPRTSPWAARPGAGNGMPAPPAGPPPADWAAAIPTDVPAARRAADPASATSVWRPDEAVDAEPGVPLGPAPAGGPGGRSSRSRAGRNPAAGTGDVRAAGGGPEAATAGSRARTAPAPAEEPGEVRRKAPSPRRNRPSGERQARAWPRIVAVISWIVLVMVVCWFYVFPWLERVLPENF